MNYMCNYENIIVRQYDSTTGVYQNLDQISKIIDLYKTIIIFWNKWVTVHGKAICLLTINTINYNNNSNMRRFT